MAATRSRRSNAGQLNLGGAMSAIADAKALREKGLTRAANLHLQDDGDVYEELDEVAYQAYVKQRKEDEAGFVENDVGEDMLRDDDEWDGQGGEEGKQKWTSNVNKPQRGRGGVAVQGSERVQAIFLGLQPSERKKLVSAHVRTHASLTNLWSAVAHRLISVWSLLVGNDARRSRAHGRSTRRAESAHGGSRP
jgi:hypothetical protein